MKVINTLNIACLKGLLKLQVKFLTSTAIPKYSKVFMHIDHVISTHLGVQLLYVNIILTLSQGFICLTINTLQNIFITFLFVDKSVDTFHHGFCPSAFIFLWSNRVFVRK